MFEYTVTATMDCEIQLNLFGKVITTSKIPVEHKIPLRACITEEPQEVAFAKAKLDQSRSHIIYTFSGLFVSGPLIWP